MPRMAELAHLTSRACLRVSGPDARSFLQGLLTNDVEALADGTARFAFLLTPQGKVLFDLFVIADRSGGLLLDAAADRREDLARRLAAYRLRAKVEIAPDERAVSAAFGAGGGAGGSELSVPDPRLPDLGARIYGPAREAAAAEDAYDAHRLALGVPDPARDCTPDKTYPIEANADLLNGIDFRKGCFVGQETTSRMKRRGQVRNRMAPLALDGPPPAFGTEVLVGELRAGEVLTGREGRAMALLRLDRIAGADLTADDRPVRCERPSWWPEDV